MSAQPPVEKIVSGGQTGVDRAALDVALERAIPCGGWCPEGRLAEDGPIPCRYPLAETGTGGYEERTRLNVRDSDATLILSQGPLPGKTADGTALTLEWAETLAMPCLVVDLSQPADIEGIAEWLGVSAVRVLNVAGPRESTSPGIYAKASEFLSAVLDLIPPRP